MYMTTQVIIGLEARSGTKVSLYFTVVLMLPYHSRVCGQLELFFFFGFNNVTEYFNVQFKYIYFILIKES